MHLITFADEVRDIINDGGTGLFAAIARKEVNSFAWPWNIVLYLALLNCILLYYLFIFLFGYLFNYTLIYEFIFLFLFFFNYLIIYLFI